MANAGYNKRVYRCAGCRICYFKALMIHNDDLDEAQPAELVEASKKFGGLTFGAVYWFCSDCKSMFTEHGCVLNFFQKSLDKIKRPVIAVANDDKQLLDCAITNLLSKESLLLNKKLDEILSNIC